MSSDIPAKRGRPPKDAPKRVPDAIQQGRREANQAALANTLALVNNLACAMAGAAHLELADSEALLISDALLGVTDEIDVQVSPLTQALINAGTTIMFVYGSKIAMHKLAKGSDDNADNQARAALANRGQDAKR